MDFLQKVDFMMEKYNLNKRSLSQNSGIPYTTIDGWYKKGYEGLKLTTLKKLSEYFNTLIDFWVLEDVTDPNYGKANGFELVVEEAEHIQKYRLIDEYGKEAVDSVLEIEYRRYIDSVQARQAALEAQARRQAAQAGRSETESAAEPAPGMVEKLVYLNPAAAGTPLYAESDFERLEFPEDQAPKNADFGIRISGKSMEPTVRDGAIVWVRKTLELPNGAVGVFMINDSAVCKRFFDDGGTIRLESDNPAFGPVQLRESDHFKLVGEVVGTTK